MLTLIRCPNCRSQLECAVSGALLTCACGANFKIENDVVEYSDAKALSKVAEVGTRDRQASGYLQHAKFPTQISRVKKYLAALPPVIWQKPVIEVACGPGPYTGFLLEAGFDVIAVDFSECSLRINRDANIGHLSRTCFVKADINELQMAQDCSNCLLMCDFLQHIDGHNARVAFMRKAFEWLAPGGVFYLSFFNFNIVNFLKGDLRGTFAGGAISYERLICKDVLQALPSDVSVDAVTPMNIFHSASPDRLAARLPGATFLSRMVAISGRKLRS